MRKKFLANLLITLAANLLVKPFWIFGIDRTVQNRLGVEEYGVYANLFAFSLVLSVLLDFGINNYNATSLSRNPRILRHQFIPLLVLKLIFGLLYLLLTLFLGHLYGFTSDHLWLLLILAINQLLAYLSTYFRSTLSGLQYFRTDALISATDRLVMSIAGVALLFYVVFPITIRTFIYIQTIGYIAAVLVSYFSLVPNLHNLSYRLDIAKMTKVLKNAAPFALLALLMMIYTKMDVILIKKMAPNGDEENGIYAQGVRLVEAVNMFSMLISGLLLPMFAKLLQQRSQLTPLVKLGLFVLLTPVITGVVFSLFHVSEVLGFLYHQHGSYASEVFRWVILTIIPMCMISIFGTLLTANNQLKTLLITATLASILNIILNSLLIPSLGALGSSLAALVTLTFVAITYAYIAVIELKLELDLYYLFQFLFYALLCSAATFVMRWVGLSFEWMIFVYCLSSIFFIFILKLVSVSQIRQSIANYEKIQQLKDKLKQKHHDR